jgi:hypothetical protein
MNQNQFVVDLGDLKITTQQRASFNKALQVTASLELAKIKTAEKTVSLNVDAGKIISKPTIKVPVGFLPMVNGRISIPTKPHGFWESLSPKQFEAFKKLKNG